MVDPVQFKSAAEVAADKAEYERTLKMIWVCTHCCCTCWTLMASGDLVCANCGVVCNMTADDIRGNWFDPANRTEPIKDIVPEITRTVLDFNDNTSNMKHTLDKAGRMDLAAFIWVAKDGFVGTWGNDFRDLTAEQQKWLAYHIELGANTLLNEDTDNADA